jgi:hypothetical protein
MRTHTQRRAAGMPRDTSRAESATPRKGVPQALKTHAAPGSDASSATTESELSRASRFGHNFADIPVHRQDAPAEKRPNKTGLPDGLKAGIESLSGMPLDHVKVHYNSSRPAQVNALAYARGHEIHVAPGQEHHLPHEAWHLVQQAQGRVPTTMQLKGGVPLNDDKGLEQEADRMGNKAASHVARPHPELGSKPPVSSSHSKG